jgi:hypothetical protein
MTGKTVGVQAPESESERNARGEGEGREVGVNKKIASFHETLPRDESYCIA